MHRKALLFCAVVMGVSSSARADLLGLTLEPYPDIFSSFIVVEYDAGAQTFAASGFALNWNDDNVPPNPAIASGTFDIEATVDNTGAATGGSISIGGSTLGFGPSLLTGTLVDFGWHSAGLFEFLFSVTGGDLATPTYFGNPGDLFGVIMNAGTSNFGGNWTANFSNAGQGVADTAPVPSPAALPVFFAAVFLGRKRRRQ